MNYVVGFAFNTSEEDVILIHKTKPKWQKGLYHGVSGEIEDGESPLETMIREFYEETGIHYRNWKEFATYSNDQEDKIHFFRAIMEDIKFYSVRSMTEEAVCIRSIYDLPCSSIPNMRWLIPLALDQRLYQDRPVVIFGGLDPLVSQILHIQFEQEKGALDR